MNARRSVDLCVRALWLAGWLSSFQRGLALNLVRARQTPRPDPYRWLLLGRSGSGCLRARGHPIFVSHGIDPVAATAQRSETSASGTDRGGPGHDGGFW